MLVGNNDFDNIQMIYRRLNLSIKLETAET